MIFTQAATHHKCRYPGQTALEELNGGMCSRYVGTGGGGEGESDRYRWGGWALGQWLIGSGFHERNILDSSGPLNLLG